MPHKAPLEYIGELAFVAPSVIALRTARMMSAGWAPDRQDRRELLRMGTEKAAAAQESLLAMGMQMARWQWQASLEFGMMWWRLWLPYAPAAPSRRPALTGAAPGRHSPDEVHRAMLQLASRGLAPIHRRAKANLNRLSAGFKV